MTALYDRSTGIISGVREGLTAVPYSGTEPLFFTESLPAGYKMAAADRISLTRLYLLADDDPRVKALEGIRIVTEVKAMHEWEAYQMNPS